MRLPAVAAHQGGEFLVRDAREKAQLGDLPAVEVEDRQNGPVALRIEVLVAVPARGQRSGFRFAVADRAGDDQVRIVEHGAERVRERVAEFAAFVDRAGRFRRGVARDPAGKRKLAEKPLHSALVAGDVGIDFAIAGFEIGVGDDGGAAVSRSGHENRVEIPRDDRAVHVRVHQVETRGRAPMPEQARLQVLDAQRLVQERIREQIDLPDRQIICGAPIRVDRAQLSGTQRPGVRLHPQHGLTIPRAW